MKEFVNPNLHVVLVHYPLAMLVVGTLIELFSFMWRRSSFRSAGRWMILIGALSAIPVATSGIYAFRDVASMKTDFEEGGGSWHDISTASTLANAQWQTLRTHLLMESFATVLAVLVVVTWMGCSDHWRLKLHWPLMVLLLLSVALAGGGAYNAGETVYIHGTGVLNDKDSPLSISDVPKGHTPTTLQTAASTNESTTPNAPVTSTSNSLLNKITFFVPPMQAHVIMAGVAVAIAMASLGLSIRKITQGPTMTQVDQIALALGGPETIVSTTGDDPATTIRATPAEGMLYTSESFVPAGRFWMLTALFALITAIGGYILLSLDMANWSLPQLWKDAIIENHRRLAHVVAGLMIVILPIVLALVSRAAPRGKILLAIFSALLIGAVSFQIWVGIAMLYDSPIGDIFKFGN